MAMGGWPAVNVRLPPGFRFHPTDEELIVHYLRKKTTNTPLGPNVVTDIDLYKYNPWDLPRESTLGDDEWYFFTPRDRKYTNGTRPNRMAGSGYWKATGIDKPILSSCRSKVIGVKKAHLFYVGRPPKGNKTNWIMLEYRLPELELPWSSKRERSMRLDDWVLCRVHQKKVILANISSERNTPSPSQEAVLQFLPESGTQNEDQEAATKDQQPPKYSILKSNNAEFLREYVMRNNHMFPLLFGNFPQDNYSCVESVNSSTTLEASNKSAQSSVSKDNFDIDHLPNAMHKRKPLELGDQSLQVCGSNFNKKATIVTDNCQKLEIVHPVAEMDNINTGVVVSSYNTMTSQNNGYHAAQSGPGVANQDICNWTFC